MRVALVLFLTLFASGGKLSFLEIEPHEIQTGGHATLSWDTAGVPSFIIGYGKVVGKGSAIVSPGNTTDFTMVTETRKGVQYKIARLLVSGSKGDDGYPSISDFDVAIRGKRAKIGYVDFQSIVWNILQSKSYGVRGDYVPTRPFVIFYTDFALRQDLVSRDERIRARRLAIAVEIYEPENAGTISFGVRTDLEFQYRGETEWRPDKDSSLAKGEAVKFVNVLEQAK